MSKRSFYTKAGVKRKVEDMRTGIQVLTEDGWRFLWGRKASKQEGFWILRTYTPAGVKDNGEFYIDYEFAGYVELSVRAG